MEDEKEIPLTSIGYGGDGDCKCHHASVTPQQSARSTTRSIPNMLARIYGLNRNTHTRPLKPSKQTDQRPRLSYRHLNDASLALTMHGNLKTNDQQDDEVKAFLRAYAKSKSSTSRWGKCRAVEIGTETTRKRICAGPWKKMLLTIFPTFRERFKTRLNQVWCSCCSAKRERRTHLLLYSSAVQSSEPMEPRKTWPCENTQRTILSRACTGRLASCINEASSFTYTARSCFEIGCAGGN